MSDLEILYLNGKDVKNLAANSSEIFVDAIIEAFRLHAEGKFVQPLKPYMRTEFDHHIADRMVAMPAYLGGDPIAGIKWVGSKRDNPEKGIQRANAMIILNDAETKLPLAILEGSFINGMRTAAITVVASKYFAKEGFSNVSCIGCGVTARMQLISMLEQFPSIERLYLYDINRRQAESLSNEITSINSNVMIIIADDPKSAVVDGDVVITCTTVAEPYIPFDWLKKGTFVSNVSIMDLHKEVFLKADKVIVDDWDQANRERKVLHQLVLEGRFSREMLFAELGEVVQGSKESRENDDEIIILNPMGMAIEDLACAHAIYKRAVQDQVGLQLSL